MTLSDFLDDPDFISQNKQKGIVTSDEERLLFPDAAMARQIIEAAHENEKSLSLSEIQQMWQRLDAEFEQGRTNPKLPYTLLKYAAIIVVAAITGVFTYSQFLKSDPYLQELAIVSQDFSEEDGARLVLGTGEELLLSKRSEIECLPVKSALKVNDQIVTVKTEKNSDHEMPAMNSLLVPFGSTSRIQLTDGSVVWLNSGSKLIYPSHFSDDKRIVYLFGEGFFEVSKDALHPFVVRTAGMDIEVLGTRFNVSAWGESKRIETVLVEGKVKLSGQNKSLFSSGAVVLEPGQKGSYNATEKKIECSEVDVELYASWIGGWLKFEGESLVEVIRKISRFYGVQYSVDNDQLEKQTITGKLDLHCPLDDVMKVLADLAPTVDYTLTNETIRLSEK